MRPYNVTNNYLKQWGVSEEKSIFPYTLFSTIEDLVKQKIFPAYHEFFNELSDSNVNPDLYEKTRTLYNYHCELPDNHPDKWYNFGDFLDYYNTLDNMVIKILRQNKKIHTKINQIFVTIR